MENKVIYLIPNKGIGGVERLHEYLEKSKQFENVGFFVLSEAKQGMLAYFFSLIRTYIFLKKYQPNVVIGSLWRVHLAMIFFRYLVGFEYIPFYHSIESRSLVDRVVSALAYSSSKTIIYDSIVTSGRFKNTDKIFHVLSLFLGRTSQKKIKTTPSKVSFVYVGRIAKVKNLEESLKFLKRYKEISSLDIRFDIYGPLEYDLNLFGYEFARFLGPLDQDKVVEVVLNYDIFLQTSNVEGFAMTAKECLRAGQFCILSPVGDLATYEDTNIFMNYKSVEESCEELNKLSAQEIIRIQENARDMFKDTSTLIIDFKKLIDELSLSKM